MVFQSVVVDVVNGCFRLASIVFAVGLVSSRAGDLTEYCQDESFRARCDDPHEVVLMESASYGRIRIGQCVRRNLGYLGCMVDALAVLDARCSGQPGGCEMSIMDPALRALKPCPKDVTWHLEAAYSCIEVLTGSPHDCHTVHHVKTSEQSGYLASSTAVRTGVGSNTCPWHIRAEPGQRVNMTLFGFVASSSPSAAAAGPDGAGSTSQTCFEVATIRDGPTRRQVNACAGQGRRQMLFVTDSNVVDVEFVVRSSSVVETTSSQGVVPPQFILHYQFVGCSNIVPPPGSSVSRDGDMLTVRCNVSGETWYLTCTGTRWVGAAANCSSHSTQTSWSTDELFGQSGSFPVGILIVVAVGVALGVFLGGTMLLLASMFMKRRQRRHGLGRPDGSDDLKSADHDPDGEQFDYSATTTAADLHHHHHLQLQQQQQQQRAKQYAMLPPDYGLRKDFVVGSTATTTVDVLSAPGYGIADYATEPRDRRLLQRCASTTPGVVQQPRIHYHVYESPQMT